MNTTEAYPIAQKLEELGLDLEQTTALVAAFDLLGADLREGDQAGQNRIYHTGYRYLELISKDGPEGDYIAELQALGLPVLHYLKAVAPDPDYLQREDPTPDPVPAWSKLSGPECLQAIAAGVIGQMSQPAFAKGELVRVAPGRPMAGLVGNVRKVERQGILITYVVAFQVGKAASQGKFTAAELHSLDSPATDAKGGYYAPVFLTPGGNEVLFNYPDMVSREQEGAQVCSEAFLSSATGLMASVNGLRPTGKVAYVEAKGTYTTATLELGGMRFACTILAGPDLEGGGPERLKEDGQAAIREDFQRAAASVGMVRDPARPALVMVPKKEGT